MRVTNNMLSNQFLSGYQKSLSRMADIQEKITASKNIIRPSDNPIGAVRNLQFTSASSTNALFTQNANDAISWMKTSDSNLATMISAMAEIKTAVSSAISANPTSSYQAVEQQIDQKIKELVQAANSQVGDRYVFGGQNDTTEPFTIQYDANGNMTAVTYNGTSKELTDPTLPYDAATNPYLATTANNGNIMMQVVPGDINASRDKVNQDGQEVFGDMMTITKTVDGVSTTYNNVPTIFKNLLEIKQHLNDIQTGANGVTADTLSNDLGTIEADRDYMISAQTTVGARQSSYQTIKERLTADSLIIAQDAKDNDGFDVAKASIESQLALNAYNTLLSVGANVMPKTLADYL
ncbi:flagellar hook-associated protein FlgL [Pelosinus propionicus]|uniref:Flagellar hook-associated protein 3 FlgL n=1 Tax=Pelosinus propionicus DSM 13327 TaxID=1123291 RepID=A0A1I4QD75_9FIRM|nr:flagellar hook-associated protein FlgL [Pelosinus propionicus]SFM37974.1 flagellar hook-associated protein 3 FlgL [Pelosinus propionicus DSM 13327]